MKKYFFALTIAALLVVFPTSTVQATLIFEGNPDQNPDHFVWDLMASMQTPNDPDCQSLAHAALDEDGTVPEGDHPAIYTAACSALASMRTSMESGMASAGESVETNLFDAADWHNIENLYFQHSTNSVVDGRISFSVPIDFMSYNFMNFMQSFGESMETREGYISLDADTVGGFANYGATLTMYNIPDYDDPMILVNGEEDTGGVVSNLVYNKDNNTITFSAAHFSSFEVTENNTATISKVNYLRYKDEKNQEKVKVSIYGENFKKNARIKFGSLKAYKTQKISSSKMIAHFMMSDIRKELAKARRSSLRISLKNRNEDTVYAKNKKIIDKIMWKKQ